MRWKHKPGTTLQPFDASISFPSCLPQSFGCYFPFIAWTSEEVQTFLFRIVLLSSAIPPAKTVPGRTCSYSALIRQFLRTSVLQAATKMLLHPPILLQSHSFNDLPTLFPETPPSSRSTVSLNKARNTSAASFKSASSCVRPQQSGGKENISGGASPIAGLRKLDFNDQRATLRTASGLLVRTDFSSTDLQLATPAFNIKEFLGLEEPIETSQDTATPTSDRQGGGLEVATYGTHVLREPRLEGASCPHLVDELGDVSLGSPIVSLAHPRNAATPASQGVIFSETTSSLPSVASPTSTSYAEGNGATERREFNATGSSGPSSLERWASILKQRRLDKCKGLCTPPHRFSLDDSSNLDLTKVAEIAQASGKLQSRHHRSTSLSSSMSFVSKVKSAGVTVANSMVPSRLVGRAHHLLISERSARSSMDSNPSTGFESDSQSQSRSLQRRRILEEILGSEQSYVSNLKFLANVSLIDMGVRNLA